MKPTALNQAVTNAGGQTALALAVGVTPGRVWQWLRGDRIPTRHFSAIAKAGGVTVAALLADELAKPTKTKPKRRAA